MIVRELITLLGFEVDKGDEARAKSSLGGLKKIAGTLAAVFVTGKLAGAIKNAIVAAGDANEVMSQLEATFGEAAAGVVAFAEDTAKGVQRSRFEIQKYAAQIGALIKPQLGSAQAAAEMSTQVAGLAIDLGSFFNATDEDALGALRSGLIGSTEPLQRFGVDLRVGNLGLDQMRLGLKGAFSELSSAQQIQVRFASIMRQTSDAQGDAARTSGSFANVLRGTQARVSEFAIAFGQLLLPLATSFLVTMGNLVDLLAGPFLTATRTAVAVIKAFAKPIPAITVAVIGLIFALKAMGLAGAISWITAFAPVILAVALVGLIGVAIAALIEDLESMGDGGKSVIGGLIGEFQFLLDETGSIFGAINQIIANAVEFWGFIIADALGLNFEQIRNDLAEAFGITPSGVSRIIAATFGSALPGSGIVQTARELTGTAGGSSQSATTNIAVEVNAPGATDAGDLGRQVATRTAAANDRVLRRTLNKTAVEAQ